MRAPILCPTREEMLATELPIEVPSVSRTPDDEESPVIYRHPTTEAMRNFGRAEAEALGQKWPIKPPGAMPELPDVAVCPRCLQAWCFCP